MVLFGLNIQQPQQQQIANVRSLTKGRRTWWRGNQTKQ